MTDASSDKPLPSSGLSGASGGGRAPAAASGSGSSAASGLAGAAPTVRSDASGASRSQAYSGTSSQRAGSPQDTEGVVADVTRRASEMWDNTSDVGSRYYRKGSEAISNMPGGSVTPLLIAGAIGYLIGWMVHGRSDQTRYLRVARNGRSDPYNRDYDGHYRNLPEYYG